MARPVEFAHAIPGFAAFGLLSIKAERTQQYVSISRWFLTPYRTDGDYGAGQTRRECANVALSIPGAATFGLLPIKRSLHKVGEHFELILNEVWTCQNRRQPHLESPQARQVIHPSIMINATVLHLLHSCAPSGYSLEENASRCFLLSSNSARFSAISFC